MPPILSVSALAAQAGYRDNAVRSAARPDVWRFVATARLRGHGVAQYTALGAGVDLFQLVLKWNHDTVTSLGPDQVTDQAETLKELARRHVREGEARLARQEAIVDKLDNQAALGRQVLETIRTSLDLAERHLQQIEAQSKGFLGGSVERRDDGSQPWRGGG